MVMQRRSFLLAGLASVYCGAPRAQADSGIVVVGHAALPPIDAALVQRLYTGRAIEVGGQLATVFNLRSGHPLRQRFLAAYLQTDEERYRAYWTVRRHIGKGAPPRELDNVGELFDLLARIPGALGYVDAKAVPPGANIVCRV
jgi:hypothetical protein